MNPNDQIRQQILQYFYDRNRSATSHYGKKGSAVRISDAKRDLKALHELTQSQVVSNLTYLIDKGWINTQDVEKTVTVRGGTIPSVVPWYEISSAGIDKIEGESEFKATPKYSGINISATGQNVITLGDGNIVNAQYATLHTELERLREGVIASHRLEDAQKVDVVSDIETVKDQLAKSQPNRKVLSHLWTAIETAVTGAGMVDLVNRIRPLIAGLLAQ
ncbi:MAG: hypothetical protein WD802_09015 [Gemmatimonadaceae bacterium]